MVVSGKAVSVLPGVSFTVRRGETLVVVTAPERDAFLRYARAQGVASPTLTVEDLFAPETLSSVRV